MRDLFLIAFFCTIRLMSPNRVLNKLFCWVYQCSSNSLLSSLTSHYVIDQSMISIFDMKKMFGSKAMQNPLHRLQCKLIIRYHFWSFSTLNQISILIFLNLYLTSLFYITKINIHFSHWNRGKMLRTPSFTSFK